MLWKGNERGTPAAMAWSVAYGMFSPPPVDIGPFEIRRAPRMFGMGSAAVTNRASSG